MARKIEQKKKSLLVWRILSLRSLCRPTKKVIDVVDVVRSAVQGLIFPPVYVVLCMYVVVCIYVNRGLYEGEGGRG
jgi:hypothetical protein